MARAGLGSSWHCLFANDFDLKKGETYRANWGSDALHIGDVRSVKIRAITGPRRSRLGVLSLSGSFARGRGRRS